MEELRESLTYKSAEESNDQTTLILMGVTGDLSTKKVVPSLWVLFKDDLLPPTFKIVGTGRNAKLKVTELKSKIDPFINLKNENEKVKYNLFWKNIFYVGGAFGKEDGYKSLVPKLEELEKDKQKANRLYYLALPPEAYEETAAAIHKFGQVKSPKTGWLRLIVEKPFGRDFESSKKLTASLAKLYKEDQIWRIDHYLGKEMVQNLITLRFANRLFGPIWNRDNIASVEILFKEPFGTFGRGGYFDSNGIIRDMTQNHLLQVLCLVAMEHPVSVSSEDIRDEKVKLLKSMKPVKLDDVVLGQYVGNPEGEGEQKKGYKDDDSVKNKSSITPTFAVTVHHIDNERWQGVPFFILAGKALNESRVEVRIRFKEIAGNIFNEQPQQNMLILRVQPNEAVYQRFMIKKPGMEFSLIETELDLTYATKYKNAVLPDAYERLLMDVFASSQTNYVRSDETSEAWRVLTPLLQQIETEKKQPSTYVFGSQGPKKVEALYAKYGMVYN